jgi:REP element-mobilizing transposase RayT
MPNHVHVLIDPVQPIAKIVQGWKSFTARWLLAQNEQLGLKIRTDTPSSKVSETQWD